MGALSDDQLLDELRRVALELDPVPPLLEEAARAAFEWRTIDAELAELVWDSAEQVAELAGVRGAGTARLLTFETDDALIELEVAEEGGLRRLLGQVRSESAEVVRLEIRHVDEVTPVDLDELGRFVAEDVQPGPISLRCHRAVEAGSTVAVDTAWVTI